MIIPNKTINIYVYKDTVTLQYEGDNNLCMLQLPESFVKQYASQNKEYNSFDEWLKNYACDETEDLFSLVIENDIKYTVLEA